MRSSGSARVMRGARSAKSAAGPPRARERERWRMSRSSTSRRSFQDGATRASHTLLSRSASSLAASGARNCRSTIASSGGDVERVRSISVRARSSGVARTSSSSRSMSPSAASAFGVRSGGRGSGRSGRAAVGGHALARAAAVRDRVDATRRQLCRARRREVALSRATGEPPRQEARPRSGSEARHRARGRG
jgi:hypothetical protein